MPKGMERSISNTQTDLEGHMVSFEFTHSNSSLLLCNIYAPNEDRPNFFRDVFLRVQNNSHNCAVIGDYNLVMDPRKDRIGSTHNKTKSLEVIKNACEELNLAGVWRLRNEQESRYSWYRTKPKLTASRSDFSLISSGLCDLCQNVGYTTGLNSDHLAHYLFLNLVKNDRGKGYWKLNVSYLKNKEYVDLINKSIDEVLETCEGMSTVALWEFLKYTIRKISR